MHEIFLWEIHVISCLILITTSNRWWIYNWTSFISNTRGMLLTLKWLPNFRQNILVHLTQKSQVFRLAHVISGSITYWDITESLLSAKAHTDRHFGCTIHKLYYSKAQMKKKNIRRHLRTGCSLKTEA